MQAMLSFSRYAAVLALPGIKGSFWASFLGRLPIGMTGLKLLLLTQASGDSYASSGLVTGANVTGLAIFAPILGRLIDRLGPRPILRICGLIYPTTLQLSQFSSRESAASPGQSYFFALPRFRLDRSNCG
ncbi:MAG: hypothetical protein ACREVC_00385 [Burkholderiales bacterium]